MIMKSSLAILFASLTTASAFAGQAFTWNGGASGNWNESANWLVGGSATESYPGKDATDDTVTIPAGTATIDLGGATYTLNKISATSGTAQAPFNVTIKNGTVGVTDAFCNPGVSYGTFTWDNATLALSTNSGWAYVIGDGCVVLANGAKTTFANRYWNNNSRSNYEIVVRDGTSEVGSISFSSKSFGTKAITVDNGVMKAGGITLQYAYGSTGADFVLTLANGGRIESTGITASSLATLAIALPTQPTEKASLYSSGKIELTDADMAVTIDATACAEGTYKVVSAKTTLTLPDGKGIDTWSVTTAEGYKGTLAQVGAEITLTVASAAVEDNEWVTEPSISKTYWNAGETAGTISLGEAKYGQAACNYTQEQINAFSVGRYTLTFTVEKTASYTGLSKSIDIIVMGPDTQAATYTWKSAVLSGNWCDPQNWTTDVGTQGFPSNVLVKAVVPSGNSPVIDLQGCTIPLDTVKASLSVNGTATLRNGIIQTGAITAPGNARVTLDAASIQFSDWYSKYAWNCNYEMSKLSSLQLLNGASFLVGGLKVAGQGNVCVIRDGTTTIGQGVTFGPSAVVTTETGLTVSNATLKLTTDFTVQNSSGSVLPCIKLQKGRIVSSNSGKPSAARFMMNAAAKTELMLKAADKAAPRILAYTVQLQNMTFAVTSVETTGRYPLAYAQDGITFVGDAELGGCTLDLSALGKSYSGRLELSEDGKTLSAKISHVGLVILIQ